MPVRRCAILFLEPSESTKFELASLLRGGDGLRRERRWLALAPHLEKEIEVDAEEITALGRLPVATWQARSNLEADIDVAVLNRLIDKGLVLDDGAEGKAMRQADERVREGHWRPLSAVFHRFARWREVDSGSDKSEIGLGTFRDMVATLGPPPPHFVCRGDPAARMPLARPSPTPVDALLAKRVTCRNWDAGRALDGQRFGHLMHRVFGAQAVFDAAPQACVVKKTSPSGGGLHPVEAYLLVRKVEDVAAGLYHYHPGEHALQPLPWPAALAGRLIARHRAARAQRADEGNPEDLALRDFAAALLAGQHWFGNAQVLVFLVGRFRRQTWKYRSHAKAYKALLLDAGHLSQTLYLTATELGLGAFITAAANDAEVEEALGLDPIEEGLIAVNGFGWRGDSRETVEFDPLHAVWPDWGGVGKD